MSKRDKWGLFMLIFTAAIVVLGLVTGLPNEQIPGVVIGGAILYWIGTGFIKDEPK